MQYYNITWYYIVSLSQLNRYSHTYTYYYFTFKFLTHFYYNYTKWRQFGWNPLFLEMTLALSGFLRYAPKIKKFCGDRP